jgi:hypothetical protein
MAQMAMAGFSAFMQIRAGQAEKATYNAKAAEAVIQGKAKALEAKRKGVAVLQNLNETLATTAARATTGGGVANTLSLTNYAMKTGVSEYYTTKDNATLAVGQADFQAGIYKTAGKQAMLNAYASAAGTLGQGHSNQMQSGGYGIG